MKTAVKVLAVVKCPKCHHTLGLSKSDGSGPENDVCYAGLSDEQCPSIRLLRRNMASNKRILGGSK